MSLVPYGTMLHVRYGQQTLSEVAKATTRASNVPYLPVYELS